ncbi:MAG: hypothetical protein WCH99_04275 [Verrucomicrobiota bacterium]
MNDRLPPVAPDKISTLVDHSPQGKLVIALCPICDRTAAATENGRSREEATADSIARIRLHIRKSHPPKTKHVKISAVVRNRSFPPSGMNRGERQAET